MLTNISIRVELAGTLCQKDLEGTIDRVVSKLGEIRLEGFLNRGLPGSIKHGSTRAVRVFDDGGLDAEHVRRGYHTLVHFSTFPRNQVISLSL